jgi:hypothetical protein
MSADLRHEVRRKLNLAFGSDFCGCIHPVTPPMLSAFGKPEEIHLAMDQFFLLRTQIR